MAQHITLTCDLCGSDKDVETLVCTYPGERSWELDICQRCYDRDPHIKALLAKARPAAKTAGRPQVRFKMTDLPPQP